MFFPSTCKASHLPTGEMAGEANEEGLQPGKTTQVQLPGPRSEPDFHWTQLSSVRPPFGLRSISLQSSIAMNTQAGHLIALDHVYKAQRGCNSLAEHVSDLAGSPRRGFRPLLGPGQLLILGPVLLRGRPAQLRDLLELVHLHTARHAGGGRGSH
jgi:hypothetical protein